MQHDISKEETRKRFPKWSEWCDENNVEYQGIGLWSPADAITEHFFTVTGDDTEKMAFKLRWE